MPSSFGCIEEEAELRELIRRLKEFGSLVRWDQRVSVEEDQEERVSIGIMDNGN